MVSELNCVRSLLLDVDGAGKGPCTKMDRPLIHFNAADHPDVVTGAMR